MQNPAAPATNAAWAELIQLVPIVTLALPFIVSGKVDLSRAGSGLVVGALLTLPVSALVLSKRAALNPILVGTGLWLWTGALAFGVPIPPLREALVEAQGFGLFAFVALIGAVTLALSPQGFIGCRHPDARFVRKASLGLFALALVALGWSFLFRHDIRAGGGLPFIVLNVVRRAVILRAPPAERTEASALRGGAPEL
ncbi:MAG TPA: hypothetical protein VFV94_07980 [Polyangiaceae bacterium]|jgi:hypothetical protein|nr:hypothetical protein [Polyangiaceae bacterium]